MSVHPLPSRPDAASRLQVQILAALQDGPLTHDELRERVAPGSNYIHVAINALITGCKVRAIEGDRYDLPADLRKARAELVPLIAWRDREVSRVESEFDFDRFEWRTRRIRKLRPVAGMVRQESLG